MTATPTPKLDTLLVFRSIHPIYGAYLLDHLGGADDAERLQALESVLELPRPLLKFVRPPLPDDLPPGPLQAKLDPLLIARGLIAAPEPPKDDDEEDEEDGWKERPPSLADKLFFYFEATHPDVADAHAQPVWCANAMLRDFGDNFNLYVRNRDLTKQEGIVFRHLLRLILLCGEFAQVCPVGMNPDDWRVWLRGIADRLTASCRAVDPASTDDVIQHAHDGDLVEGEATAAGK